MKDSSRMVTLVALAALLFALWSMNGNLPGLEPLGDSLFWVLWGVLIFYLVRGKGCCGRVCGHDDEDEDEGGAVHEEDAAADKSDGADEKN
jgi:hypothetical protein